MKILKWVKLVCLSVAGLIALLLVVGFAYEHIARTMVLNAFPAQGQTVSVGDHSLNVRSKGNGGPLVVFESGLDQGGAMVWGKVQEQTAMFTSTVSYDRAGIMWSERGSNPKTCEAMADELYELLDKSDKKGPYILVGHSLAGYILRSFIAKHTAEIAGIVFVEAAHPDQWNRLPPELITTVPPRWVVRLASNVGAVRLYMPSGYPGVPKEDPLNVIVGAYMPVSLPATVEESENVRLLADEAAEIRSFGDIPLIVITGTGENRKEEFPSEALAKTFVSLWSPMQEDLLKMSTRSKHVLAAKSGHFVMLAQPDVVVEAIKELVNEYRDNEHKSR
jgi:pimeloyl-ACP methyl ester carboxylesterase